MDPVVASIPIPLACRMVDVHSKKYPKQYIAETQLGADSYPLYRRSSPDNGGQVSNICMRIGGSRVDQQIDNRWIVPYNKLLLRSMNCHCNVELCMSIKSIKYVLKYVHKGCDQAMFALQSSQVDEILDHQNARYVSSNEATWRILEFPIHERDPPFNNLLSTWRMVSVSTSLKTLRWIGFLGTLRKPR